MQRQVLAPAGSGNWQRRWSEDESHQCTLLIQSERRRNLEVRAEGHGHDFVDLSSSLRQVLAFPMQEGRTLVVCRTQGADKDLCITEESVGDVVHLPIDFCKGLVESHHYAAPDLTINFQFSGSMPGVWFVARSDNQRPPPFVTS